MIIKLTHAHIIGTIIAYIFGVFLVPLVISFSKKEGLVDLPNERKFHKIPVSRLGGVAIWASTMLTFLSLIFLSYYPYGSLLSGILLGSSLMFLLGLVDDVYNLDAKFKLFIQLSIATVVYLLGVKINSLPFLGGIDLGFWSYPITLLWIVGISNAVNFIDGVDGLAGSVITVNSITLAIIAIAMTPSNPIVALIGFILAGSMLAFLTYNFNPAKIFMGDTGSLALGGFIGTLAVLTGLELILPIMGVMFVLSALSDIIQVLHYKRTKKRVFLMAPLHHHFEQKGVHENRIVVVYIVITTVMCLSVLGVYLAVGF